MQSLCIKMSETFFFVFFLFKQCIFLTVFSAKTEKEVKSLCSWSDVKMSAMFLHHYIIITEKSADILCTDNRGLPFKKCLKELIWKTTELRSDYFPTDLQEQTAEWNQVKFYL